jgi:methylated-DNA-protein-cysteine methyltransferase related protein
MATRARTSKKSSGTPPAPLPADAPFRDRVHAAIRAVPEGRVVSYGGIAAIIGQPRAARAVGTTLCNLPDGSDVPWWRVINRNGEISIKCTVHGPALQRALLNGEGVRFDSHGRVAWERFGWNGTGLPRGIREDDAADDPPATIRRSTARSAKTLTATKRATQAAGNAASEAVGRSRSRKRA